MLRQTDALPPISFRLTMAEWKQAIQHIKITTARGVCGWHAQEFRDLPSAAQEDLYHIFLHHSDSMLS